MSATPTPSALSRKAVQPRRDGHGERNTKQDKNKLKTHHVRTDAHTLCVLWATQRSRGLFPVDKHHHTRGLAARQQSNHIYFVRESAGRDYTHRQRIPSSPSEQNTCMLRQKQNGGTPYLYVTLPLHPSQDERNCVCMCTRYF